MAAHRPPSAIVAAIFSALLTLATPAASEDIAVIVARDAPTQTLDTGTLRDIYLKKIFLDTAGRKLVPVNLPADTPLREAFSQAVFHAHSDALQDYWNQRYFHGITPPYVLASEDAVVRFVARTPGAIGYVAVCHVDESVRVVVWVAIEAETDVGGCVVRGTQDSEAAR